MPDTTAAPPPQAQDAAAAVPDVARSPRERILGGIGGVISGGTGMDFTKSPLYAQLQKEHGMRVATAQRHYANAATYSGALGQGEIDPQTGKPTGIDPASGKPMTPEQRQMYEQMYEGAWGDYSKAAGVNKDAKGKLQQHKGLLDILVNKGHQALQSVLGAHKAVTGGGQGASGPTPPPSSGAPAAAPAATPAASAPPPSSSAAPPQTGGPTPPPAAAAPPAQPAPATSSPKGGYDAQAQLMAPELARRMEENHGLDLYKRKSDIDTAAKIAEEKARPLTQSITSKAKNLAGTDIQSSYPGITTPTGEPVDPKGHYDLLYNSGDRQFYASPSGQSASARGIGQERADNLNKTLTALQGKGELPPYLKLNADSTEKDYQDAKDAVKNIRTNALKETPVDISDDAVEAFANVVLQGGQLPNLGLGGANARIKIINRIGQIAAGKGKPSTGIGNTIVTKRAALTALTKELGALQTQRGAVGSFEGTALKNLELFEKTAEKVVDSGSPWVNKPLRQVDAGGLGSDDVVAYNTARNVALTEIGRVLASPNMAGVLTDSQRAEVGQLIGPGATLSNVLAASKILKQDMENRKDSLDDELGSVRDQIGGGTGGVTPPPASSGTSSTTRKIVIK